MCQFSAPYSGGVERHQQGVLHSWVGHDGVGRCRGVRHLNVSLECGSQATNVIACFSSGGRIQLTLLRLLACPVTFRLCVHDSTRSQTSLESCCRECAPTRYLPSAALFSVCSCFVLAQASQVPDIFKPASTPADSIHRLSVFVLADF
jgi:hypothetical protein